MKDYSVLDNIIRMVGDTIKQAFDKGYKQEYTDGNEEKQADGEIRVGDEVECPQIDGKGIVINKANKDTLLVLSANMDGLLRTEENKVHKTGKHIDAIEDVLEQMREDKE